MTTTSERPKRTTFAAALALVALCLLAPAAASAQWATPDPTNGSTNYPNGNVGVGTTAPNYKVEVSGSTSRNTLALTGDGDTVGFAGIKIQALTTTGIATNRISQFNLHMRKDGWYSGDSSGPSFIIETVSKAGGYAAPFMITPTNNVILNGGTGASGLSYGWVGIGTTSPANLLHVSGASSVGVIRVSGSGGGFMNFYDTAASANQKLYQWRSEGGLFRMALVNDAENAFAQQNILVANSAGNVGLGTASPNERLHVNGGMVVTGAASEQTGVNGLFLGFSGTAANIDAVQQGTDFRALSMSAKSLSFNTWNGSALVLGLYQSNAGNVGVGTATPGYKLDVAGQVRSSSGGFVFPDGSTQTKASVGTVTGVTAGTGLTGGGTSGSLTLTNSDPGSSQFIFKNVANAAGAAQFSAGSNNDAIRFEGTGGTTISFDPNTKKVTIGSSSSASSGWTDGGSSVSLTNTSANVGIGPVSPSQALTVSGYSSNTYGNTVQVVGTAPSGSAQNQLNITPAANAWGLILGANNAGVSPSAYHCANCAHVVNFNNAPLIFGTNNAERVRVDGSGNVGIGTSSPAYKLDVSGSVRVPFGSYYQLTGDGGTNRDISFMNPGGNDNVGILQAYPQSGANVASLLIASPRGAGLSGLRSRLNLMNTDLVADPNNQERFSLTATGSEYQMAATNLGTGALRPIDIYASGAAGQLYLATAGNVGVGTTTPGANYKLDVNGNANVGGALSTTGAITAGGAITGATVNATYQDVAEWVPSSQKLSAGTVVVLDTEHTNQVLASSKSYDTKVAGVVSAQPGVILGQGGEGRLKVATTGRVKVKVDATRAPVKVGDLLVTSDVEGVAMKSIPVDLGGTQIHRPGTIIGKALEPLSSGTGEILVLLSLQ